MLKITDVKLSKNTVDDRAKNLRFLYRSRKFG